MARVFAALGIGAPVQATEPSAAMPELPDEGGGGGNAPAHPAHKMTSNKANNFLMAGYLAKINSRV